MNRKTFLSTLAVLISIPFIGKSKEEEPTKHTAHAGLASDIFKNLYEPDHRTITIYIDGKTIGTCQPHDIYYDSTTSTTTAKNLKKWK